MRISFQMLSHGPLRNIANSLERYSKLNIKVGSMKNFQRPSDDPIGVRKAMAYDTLIKQNKIYSSNTADAMMYLDVMDSTLLSVKGLIDNAKTIALEMRSSTADSGENIRASAAIEVNGILNDVKDMLNTRFHNKYIFSGHMIDSISFEEVDGSMVYRGDDSPLQLRVGPNRLMDVTVPGSAFLSLGEDERIESRTMNASILPGTNIDDLNNGEGIFRGAFTVTNGAGMSVDFDVSGASTVQDVLDMVNGSGLGIMAGLNSSNGIALFDIVGNGEMTVTEAGEGTTAEGLGILGTSTGGVLTGSALDPLLTENSIVSGVDLLGSILLTGLRVTVDGIDHDVDFFTPAYPTTVGDMLDRINLTVPGVSAELNETRDGIVLISDNEFSVGEIGAGTTAADLGLLGDSETTEPYSLFGALENLRTALENNDPGSLDSVIGQLEYVVDHVLEIEAAVGARGRQVESINEQLLDTRVSLLENLSFVEDIDLSEVLTELAEAQVAYEAALQTAVSIYNLSLLNYYS
ncbi:MAG: hypothetical protein KOO63_10230 [Bacteroidales bacterium]|nr:hypothetical protein [Candidatus Latescibacterota bacterium]